MEKDDKKNLIFWPLGKPGQEFSWTSHNVYESTLLLFNFMQKI